MIDWHYTKAGAHTHVRVFMHGAKCGDLCFRNEEFAEIRRDAGDPNPIIRFVPDDHADTALAKSRRLLDRIISESQNPP